MEHKRSQALFEKASHLIPGGVNSPVRAFRAVGGEPLFIQSGHGAWLTDEDQNIFLDCIGSWGPLLLGHAHPRIVEAVSAQLGRGTSYGAPTLLEVELAELIVEAVPSIEKVRLVSSGTEATMSAIRVARGYTGRNKIVKFDGCYHGHADFLLAKSGSGIATLGLPECAGVPPAMTADTITLPFNDPAALEALFSAEGEQIACVILEPVCGNMGCVLPRPGYLQHIRDLTARYGTVLIFDEVMTGFRLAFGGAQQRFGITPDMTALGKIVGGGLPLAAYGGRSDIMEFVAPVGSVYQAGTLSGNPVAVTAGLEMLRILREEKDTLYANLERTGERVAKAMCDSARLAGIPVVVNQIGSMLTVFFTEQTSVENYFEAKQSDVTRFARWFRSMLEEGVYWPPSQFETAFFSDAMRELEISLLARASENAFRSLTPRKEPS